MESAVLDEPAVRLEAAADRAGDVDTPSLRLERRLVELRRAERVIREGDAERREELEIRLIAGHRQHPVVLDLLPRDAHGADDQRRGPDLLDGGAEERADASLFDAVLEVRADPVLHAVGHRRRADDERDLGAVPIAVERRFRRRVLCADDGDLLFHVRVRLAVIVGDLGKRLSRHAEQVRPIEETGDDDHRPGGMPAATLDHRERARRALDA